MLSNVKVAFFDIDKTLLNDNREITEKTKKSLNYLKEKNIKIVLATGRVEAYAYKYAKELGIVDYIISNTGALIYDFVNDKYIYKNPIDKDTISELWNFANKIQLGITLNEYMGRFSNVYSTAEANYNTIVNSLDDINTEVFGIVFSSMDHDKIKSIIDYINKKNLKISYISSHYFKGIKDISVSVDVNKPTVGKGEAIKWLVNNLGIDINDTIAFGDGDNDIDMFNACKYKVAMENANDNLKKIATHLTLSNNEDGIAYFISNNL